MVRYTGQAVSSLLQMIGRKSRALHGVSVESDHGGSRVKVFSIFDFPSQKKDDEQKGAGRLLEL